MDIAFFLTVATVTVMATGAATAVAVFLGGHTRGAKVPAPGPLADGPNAEGITFLFDDERLIDSSPEGLLLLAPLRGRTDWARLGSYLEPRLPGVMARLGALPPGGEVRDSGGSVTLEARRENAHLRLTLRGATAAALSRTAAEEELDLLRRTVETAPWPVWRTDPAGEITWANAAYLALTGSNPDDIMWPLPRLFLPGPRETAPGSLPGSQRIQGVDGEAWFDCVFTAEEGGDTVGYAIPADGMMRMEQRLRGSQQAMSDAFMGLAIGLAVFDRGRKLQMFNPALADLTRLGPDFLAARPSLFAFLERLREQRMLPERRDYASWRQQMTEVEKAAEAGGYEETWSLPGGQTYRVTGQPHPEGAITFLLEDITGEITLSRRFRAEIELSQEVIDAIPDGIAVFSAAGMLLVSNRAYASLWGIEEGEDLTPVDIDQAIALWEATLPGATLWRKLRQQVGTLDRREEWTAAVRRDDATFLHCRATPLSDGATLVAFRIRPAGERLLAAE
ncbi:MULTISPECIES: PAS-domain containing protein [unclassified Haematobacter]|uniref:PAS-domain containing protein n=1 Tax=unclassified Haematobacter TaxID=2640585 RepID=UPI0025C0ECDB|nr:MULTISPECIES: PAS-domain containing protein [unclassified Haematobacter]